MKKLTQTQISSFLEQLQSSKEDVLHEEQLLKVQLKKSDWEVSISRNVAAIARVNQQLNNAIRQADLETIIRCKNELAAYESGLKVAQEYFAVLFPA